MKMIKLQMWAFLFFSGLLSAKGALAADWNCPIIWDFRYMDEETSYYSNWSHVPSRYNDTVSIFRPTGLFGGQGWAPEQKLNMYGGPYLTATQMELAQITSPMPLVDGCGASVVPLELGPLPAYIHSGGSSYRSPYGGYGVFSPFDIRFGIQYDSLNRKVIDHMVGGVVVERFAIEPNPPNLKFPNRQYSTARNGNYVIGEESFSPSDLCSLKVRNDDGSIIEASCLYDRAQDSRGSIADIPKKVTQWMFLKRVVSASGVITIYNYVPGQEYLSSIETKSSTGAPISTITLQYEGYGYTAKLTAVSFRDEIAAVTKQTTLGYVNNSLTRISSERGVINLSYNSLGRLQMISTSSQLTFMPVGTIKFDYSASGKVSKVTGPAVVSTENGSQPESVSLTYDQKASWRSPQIVNAIIATNNITGLKSYVSSWFQQGDAADICESDYCITYWDDVGNGSYADYKEIGNHQIFHTTSYFLRDGYHRFPPVPIAAVERGNRNGYKTYNYYDNRANVDLSKESRHGLFLAESAIVTPNMPQPKRVYFAEPIKNQDGKTYLDEFFQLNPLTGEMTQLAYDAQRILKCSNSGYVASTARAATTGRCSEGAVSEYLSGVQYNCKEVAYGRCVSSDTYTGGKNPAGGAMPKSTVTVTPDANYPWLDASVSTPSGTTTMTRDGLLVTHKFLVDGQLISESTAEFDFFGVKNLTVKPFGADGNQNETLSSSVERYATGLPRTAVTATGDAYAYGLHSSLGAINSVSMTPISSPTQPLSSTMTLNSAGIPTSVAVSAGQSSTTTASVGIEAWQPGISEYAPVRPADQCDPTSATQAGTCMNDRRYVCRRLQSPDGLGTYWGYWELENCAAPVPGNANYAGKCVMDYTIKGLAIPVSENSQGESQYVDVKFPTCVYFKKNSQANCCDYLGCSYSGQASLGQSGQNIYNGRYRCENVIGRAWQPNCDLVSGDYCSVPPPSQHLPSTCSTLCPGSN